MPIAVKIRGQMKTRALVKEVEVEVVEVVEVVVGCARVGCTSWVDGHDAC